MRKDNLNTNVFTLKNKKNYRRFKEISEQIIIEIRNYFKNKGFNVIKTEQTFRYIYGVLDDDKSIYFFKMASTRTLNERINNEVVWSNYINNILQKANINIFYVPTIINTGTFRERSYFLTKFYGGNFLAYKEPPQTEKLYDWIKKIVGVNIFLLNLKNPSFPRDYYEYKDGFCDLQFKIDEKLTKVIKGHGLRKVLEIAKNLKFFYEPAINHGDFVPWHMINTDHDFVLVDGECASSKMPRFYDISYFYHRVYTSGQNPGIAKRYLNQVSQSISHHERNKFDKLIQSLIASRIIAGFWDAKNEQKNFDYHIKLKQDFLNNELY